MFYFKPVSEIDGAQRGQSLRKTLVGFHQEREMAYDRKSATAVNR
jgi:hypothetical protein